MDSSDSLFHTLYYNQQYHQAYPDHPSHICDAFLKLPNMSLIAEELTFAILSVSKFKISPS